MEKHRRLSGNQSHLIQTEKMASLGQLAAGIAHEINNPLGYVISNLETLGRYVTMLEETLKAYEKLEGEVRLNGEGSPETVLAAIADIKNRNDVNYIREDLQHLLKETNEGTLCIRDITQRLRIFTRQDDAQKHLFNVNESVETALKLTWNELKYKCKVRKDLREVPPVLCYPGRLSQVFMNLLVNAAHAIREQGEIHVASEAVGSDVAVRVSDTGCGIKKEHLKQIFSPFFTTKSRENGTGLGLAISHDIVKEHGGRIEVESAVDRGSTFTVILPAA